MAEEDMITMSRREAKRLHLIHQALDKKLTQLAVADLLGLSDRQIRRMIRRIRDEGDTGICHRSRGKPSNHRIPRTVKERALKLFQQEYADFNLAHATEKLVEVHGILIHDETLRLWLQEAQISYPRRRVKKHRQRRERKAHRGEMVQIDGSHHDWFEGRGPSCVFMGYIDDASSRVYGWFYDYEGTWPAMGSMKGYIQRYGIPQSVYVDKHTTYKSWAEPTIEEQLSGHKPRSHFEKSLDELEIEVIHAHSPQAKGRVERLFKTLQDRLLREMRLVGIKSVEEANAFLKTYLPKYNRQFQKPTASNLDVHRPAPSSRELDRILCIKEERTVKNDFTIAYHHTLYQIEQATRAKKVTVEERLDGTLRIRYKGKELKYRKLTPRSVQESLRPHSLVSEKTAWIPPADHPWRKTPFSKRERRRQLVAAP